MKYIYLYGIDFIQLLQDSEDNLFYCLEAGSKNEFRQRLEKTIHVIET